MQSRRSLPRLIIAGFILSIMPAVSFARQNFLSTPPVNISLPIEIMKTSTNIEVRTSINRLKLSELAGDKKILIGDALYVHLTMEPQSSGQNNHVLRYPYAVTKNRSPRKDALTVSLRGVVTDKIEDTVSVQYQFENLAARSISASQMNIADEGVLMLEVDRRAVGHLTSMIIDGKAIPIR